MSKLRLERVYFSLRSFFLAVEILKILHSCMQVYLSYTIEPEFKQLPKFVRAVVDKQQLPLECSVPAHKLCTE